LNFAETLQLDFPPGHDGTSKFEFRIQDIHLNTQGVLHGGLCSTLIDMGIATAVRTVVPEDKAIMTVNLNVQFLGGGSEGIATVTGRTTFVGKRLVHGEAEIRLGDRLLARGTGTWYARARRDGA